MLIAIWPLVIAVVGLLCYALAGGAKIQEIGKWMFIIGLFWLIAALAGKALHLG